jgi:hypothetical protein
MLNANALKSNRLAWKVRGKDTILQEVHKSAVESIANNRHYWHHSHIGRIDEVHSFVESSVKTEGVLFDILSANRGRYEAKCKFHTDASVGEAELDTDAPIEDYINNDKWCFEYSIHVQIPSFSEHLRELVYASVKRRYNEDLRERWKDGLVLDDIGGFFSHLSEEDTDTIAETYVDYAVRRNNNGPGMRPIDDTSDRSSWRDIDEARQFYIGSKLDKKNLGVIVDEYEYGDKAEWFINKNKYGMYYKVAFITNDGPVVGWFNNQYLKNASKANLNRLRRELDELKREHELESA